MLEGKIVEGVFYIDENSEESLKTQMERELPPHLEIDEVISKKEISDPYAYTFKAYEISFSLKG